MIKKIYEIKKDIVLSNNDSSMNNLIDRIKEYHSDNIVDISIQTEHSIYIKFMNKLKYNVWDNYELFNDIINEWLDLDEPKYIYLFYNLYILSEYDCIIEV